MWALQDQNGSNLSVLAGALNRSLSFRRSSTAEAAGEIDLDHDDAYTLVDASLVGLPRLRCFRLEEQPDKSLLARCRFSGLLSSLDEGGSGKTLTFAFRDAFDVLEGRFTGEVFGRDVTAAAQIAVDLISGTELEWPTGIAIGTLEPTEPLDATYERKRISEAIVELSSSFDFELVPYADATGQGSQLATFQAWARQGADRPEAVFGYGDGTLGNCSDATRKTGRPVNRAIVRGDEGIIGFAEDAVSIQKYGLWTVDEGMSDTLDVSVLNARARDLLRPNPERIVGFNPDPGYIDDAGDSLTPRPWLDYWLGDTVRLSVREGAYAYDGKPRIDGITIELDDEGYESSHAVTVNTDFDPEAANLAGGGGGFRDRGPLFRQPSGGPR